MRYQNYNNNIQYRAQHISRDSFWPSRISLASIRIRQYERFAYIPYRENGNMFLFKNENDMK